MNRIRNFYKKIRERFATQESRFAFETPRSVHRDWSILLGVFSILTVTAVAGAVLFFYRVQTGAVYTQEARSDRPSLSTINRQELTDTLEQIETQQNAFERLQTQQPDIANPAQ